MIKIKFFIIVVILIYGCKTIESEKDLLNKKDPVGVYGNITDISKLYTLEDLLNSPDKFLGDKVFIFGKITEVCPMRGCWINVKDKDEEFQIRVKVTDGNIVFPLSSIGHSITVEGVFSKLNFSKEKAIQWKVHLAEEKGEILNPDSVVIEESDLIEYRINGLGAKIYPI